MEKFSIWQNYNLDLEDYKDIIMELYSEEIENNERDMYSLMYEINEQELEYARDNFHYIPVKNTIVVCADIGRWNGRYLKIAKVGDNMEHCLKPFSSDYDHCDFYVDEDGDFKTRQSHHDGTTYATFRELLNDDIEDIYDYNDFMQKTKPLGERILNVYGAI